MTRHYLSEGKNLLKSWFSKREYARKDGHYYMDLHTHFSPLKFYKDGLDTLIDEAMKRVDVLALVGRGLNRPYNLTYNDFKEALKDSGHDYRDLGRIVEIKKDDGILYVIEGHEVQTKQNLHFLTVGSSGRFHDYQDITDAFDVAKQDGITILPHPFSVNAPVILGRMTNKKERDVFFDKAKDVDAIEIFNTMNNLWLFRSNATAKSFAEKNSIPGIASSDTHSDLNQIGLAGIFVDKSKIKTGSDHEFIESLRNAIKNKDFEAHTDYDNPFTFAKRTIWPHLKRARSLKEVTNLVLFFLMNKPKYKQYRIDAGY